MRAHLTIAKALRGVANAVEVEGAIRALREAPMDPTAALEFLSNFAYGDVRVMPFQVREEILALLVVLQQETPQRLIEIGTAQGGTLFLFTLVAADNATIVSVDMPGAFGGGYRRTNGRLYRSFAREGQRVRLIRGDSHAVGTAAAVQQTLGAPADFLFIDGDHTYNGVKRDFELYAPLVRGNGLIAFHDIVDGPPEAVGGVPEFWREIRGHYNNIAREFVRDTQQGGYGIGLIRKGPPLG